MSSFLDLLLVGLALLASVLYAVMTLGPRAWRQRMAAALSSLGLSRITPKTTGACGGCDNCAAPDAGKDAAGAETRVPVDEIPRRKA
jgi:hypothetical protein